MEKINMKMAAASLLGKDPEAKQESGGLLENRRHAGQAADVAILCQFFDPEYVTSARLSWDTAKYLADSGMKVKAICGYPREYHTAGGVPLQETLDGVHIRRLRYLQLKRSSRLGRLINYFSFTAAVIRHIGVFRHCETVMVYSSPPVLPVAAVLAAILFGCRIAFISYDVYPEIAYASGNLSPGGVITRVMQGINRSLFKRADAVVALTDEMRGFLLRNRPELSEDRVVTIANWAHEAPSEGAGNARRELGYTEDDFVVSYFGNLGVCQDATALLQAMELLKDQTHIKFVVAGHGSKLPLIRQAAEHLPNVKLCGFLMGEDFDRAVAASSCGIVSLERGLTGMCAPSKYYSYLQARLPVLAVVEEESYIAAELREKRAGLSSDVGDGRQLAQNILTLYSDRALLSEMADNAGRLYEQQYRNEVGLTKYASLVKDVLCVNCGQATKATRTYCPPGGEKIR